MTDLATLARRYVEARDEVTRLTRERNACVCDYEPREVMRGSMLDYDPPLRERETDLSGFTLPKGGTAVGEPCWKRIDTGDGPMTEYGRGPDFQPIGEFDGWCVPCAKRRGLHAQLRAVKATIPGRLSALISHTRIACDIPKPARPVLPVGISRPVPEATTPRERTWLDELEF